MENITVIITMLLLCLNAKDKRLLLLIAGSCSVLELVYMANIDIALYYSACAMIGVITAVVAITVIKSTTAKTLAIFLSAFSLLCLALVPDWSYTVNEWLQFKLNDFNAILVFILISLGMASSGNITK